MSDKVGGLLPCPFCGTAAKESFDEGRNQEWWIICGNDSCDIAPMTSNRSQERNRAMWNRRAAASAEQPQEPAAWLEITEDGDAIGASMINADKLPKGWHWEPLYRKPVAAASSALAQEPVAWRREWDGDESDIGMWVYEERREDLDSNGQWQPLYAEPVAPASATRPTDWATCAYCGELRAKAAQGAQHG